MVVTQNRWSMRDAPNQGNFLCNLLDFLFFRHNKQWYEQVKGIKIGKIIRFVYIDNTDGRFQF